MRDLKVFHVICRVVVVTAVMFPLSRPSYGQAPDANTKTQPETDKEGTTRSTASPDEQPDALLEQAKSLLDRGSLDRAEHAVRQYLDKHPVSADGHFLLGYVLFKEAKAEASLAEYTEGARYHDPSAFDLKVVALNYVLLGSYTDADHWLTRSLEWNPKDSEGWYYLGRTALAPDSASPHFMLGQVYRKLGMTEKAKLELARGAALNATRSQAYPPHPLD